MANYYLDDDGKLTNVNKKKKKKGRNYVLQEDGSIQEYKVPEPTVTTKKEGNERSWFNKGLFEDGYDFGDVTKSFLGTYRDSEADMVKGILGIGEGAIDFVSQGASGVAKAFGNDNLSERINTFIERDLIKEKEEHIDKIPLGGAGLLIGIGNHFLNDGKTEEVSVLGDKSDSLVQSAGQLLGTAALQGVGVPWWLTTGVTSVGAGVEEAYQNDATWGEATGYGVIKGGADVLTEKIFGGIKFGGKALDDGLKKKLGEAITNKTLKTMSKFGLDVAGEGTEEVIAEIVGNIGKGLTYEDEKTMQELLTSEEAMDGYLEVFIGGAVLGGGVNVGKAYKSLKTGRDYDTGLSDSEQTVIDAEATNRQKELRKYKAMESEIDEVIRKQEETVGKLTDKAKVELRNKTMEELKDKEFDLSNVELSKDELAEIEAQVKEDFEKGYITTDTIENTLFPERTKKANALLEERKTADDKRKAEIDAELESIGKTIDGFLNENYRLKESYRQRQLQSEEFQVELTEKDSDLTKGLVEEFKKHGVGNNRQAHETFEFYNKLSNDSGIKIKIRNTEELRAAGRKNPENINGFIAPGEDGKYEIVLNMDHSDVLKVVAGHEITHTLEKGDHYAELQNALKEYATTKGVYDKMLSNANAIYEGVENANPENEVTAQLAGEYLLTDEAFVKKLAAEKPNIFTRVFEEIKHIYKMATAGSKEARQLEKAKRMYEKAYRETRKTAAHPTKTKSTTEADSNTGSTKLSASRRIVTDEDVSEYLNTAAKNKTKRKTIKAWEDGERVILRSAEETKSFIDDAIEDADVTKQAAYGQVNERLSSSVAEMNEALNIKDYYLELNPSDLRHAYEHSKENPEYPDNIPLTKEDMERIPEYIDNFTHVLDTVNTGKKKSFVTGTRVNGYTVIVEMVSDGRKAIRPKTMYKMSTESYLEKYGEVIKKKKASLDAQAQRLEVGSNRTPSYSTSSTDNIPINEKKVNRELTAEQQEYFKDSKVRDEEGNLKVMYHGTSAGGHTMFDPYGKSKYGLFGVGSYFTDNKSVAESYTEKGKGNNKQIYEVYLNITNPIDMDAPAIPTEWKKALPEADFPQNGTNEAFYRAMEDYFEGEGYAKWEASETALEVMERMGYDGITHIGGGRFNKKDETRHQVYIAFQPEQIKNIDNAKPTEDPDIRYSLSNNVKETTLDYSYGETLYRMQYVEDGKELGWIEYGEYDGEPNVKMIEVSPEHRRKGIGKKLLQQLQKKYPDTEINFGMSTPDGTKLIESATYQVENKEVVDKIARIKEIKDVLAEYDRVYNDFFDNDTPLPSENFADDYNDLHDEMVDLQKEVRGKRTEKTFVRYSLFDNKGRTLSEGQQKRFKDSKVRDDDGSLLTMYHGTPDGSFTVFKDGSYFTPNKAYADRYQNEGASSISFGKVAANPKTFEVYLDIKKPFDINDPEAREIYINDYIKGGNAMGINPYLSDAEYNAIETIDWTEGEDLRDFLIENEYDYDGLVLDEGADGGYGEDVLYRGKSYVVFSPEQVKSVDNENPTDDEDIRLSSSQRGGLSSAMPPNYGTRWSDILMPREEAIAPLPEGTISNTETVEDIAPVRPMAVERPQEPSVDMGRALTDEDLPYVEQQRDEAFRHVVEDYEYVEDGLPYELPPVEVKNPLEDRNIEDVGNRSVKAYMYENPEVKPFFQREAQTMLSDLQNSTKGQRFFNDQVYYDTNGESGFFGSKRHTSEELAYLLDNFKYTYADIEKGLRAIIEDHGKENNAVSKRIEFLLDERLREGYTDFMYGEYVDPDNDYINLLREKQITEYNDEAYNQWVQSLADVEAPEEIAPIESITEEAPARDIAPVRADIGPTQNGVQQTYDFETNAVKEDEKDVELERLEKKKQAEYKKLGSQVSFTSRKATDLYEEVKSMRKGVRVSSDLGYILDSAFYGVQKHEDGYEVLKDSIYRDITDALLDVESNPANVVNPNSKVESVIRRAIEQRYNWSVKEIESMKLDSRAKARQKIRNSLVADENMMKMLMQAKDKPKLLLNNTDTVRVNEIVFGREAGKKINELVFQKTFDNEAKNIRWKNEERADLKKLGIKPKSKMSAAVQKYGEGEYVNEFGDMVKYDDDALAREFPNKNDQAKIINAANRIREKYDVYIDTANDVLTSLGFDPIPKRKDYMRHFQALNDIFSEFGTPFNPQVLQSETLPTDINGMTEFFTPQKNFFASAMERTGARTTLDAITGIDEYLEGIGNLIYHTEDIQRGRALEELVRSNFGRSEGAKKIEEDVTLTDDERLERLEKIKDNHLSNYAAWLREWTNNVAGKKSGLDRGFEHALGRIFPAFDELRKAVGSNMIGFNLSSSLTNAIASVQAMAKTNKVAVTKGTVDTFKNIVIKDDFIDKNEFLTARFGSDKISKTPWERVRDSGYIFMKGMDYFTSNQIVRSKYHELVSKGMSEEQAHAEAGRFAARIMGDRTKGANPLLYNSKAFNIVAQFQLEVNNQVYSMFYDTYHESKEKANDKALRTAAGMTFTLGQLFAFTHLFGKGFESLAGYNPTLDVIGIFATALGMGGDDEEDKPLADRLEGASMQLLKALPYSSLFVDGGRIPIGQALPVSQLIKGEDEYGNEKSRVDIAKETLPYYVLPGGYNQIKKTATGLAMFDEDLPLPGSYTDSGNLRFPVDDNIQNRIQAGLFGQWANKNAGEYFDRKEAPLKEKQIQEFKELDIPIADYLDYRKGLKEHKKTEDKLNYIADLDIPFSKKNIMANNVTDRKEPIDMEIYDDFGSLEEFDFAMKNPEKYAMTKAVGGYKSYKTYSETLYDIKADKDSNGKTINGSRKEKVAQYINGLDADYGAKLVLFKSEYPADDRYNYEIIEYLNNRGDISYEETEQILRELGFTVDQDGTVRW